MSPWDCKMVMAVKIDLTWFYIEGKSLLVREISTLLD